MMVSLVLSLTCAPVVAVAMPNPAPATQTDKQKAAAQKKKEAEKKKKEAEKAKAAKEKQKAAAAKQKEAEKKKAAAAKANEQKQKATDKQKAEAAKQQAKQQAERDKAAAERAKQAQEREAAQAKREAEEEAARQKQVREYEKQMAELENPKPEPVHLFNIGIRAGYSAMMDKIQTNNDPARNSADQRLKGGGGAGLDLSYSLAYLNFMFETGLDFRFLNSASAYAFSTVRNDLAYPGTKYTYLFDNLNETRNMLGIGIPVMLGAQFERFYFLLGAKVHYALPMGYSQSGKYDITVKDPAYIDPYGMGIHNINGQTNQKIQFKVPEVSLAAEIGIDLDDWLQAEPDPKKRSKVKAGERLPFGKEYIHYRVGLFAEYGVVNSNATPAALPVEFAPGNVEVKNTNTLLAMNGDTKLNNLFVGAKFTIQFEVPGKKPSQLTPPASFAIYSVVDANTNEPLSLATVETSDSKGKIAMREKQVKAKGTKQRHGIGSYTATAKADGYYDGSQRFEIERVGVTEYVTIRLRQRPVFRVRITNMETGAALPATVEIRPSGTETAAYTLTTDSASGSARIRLAETTAYSLYINQMGYETLTLPIVSVGDSMNVQLKPIKKGEVFIMHNMFFATNRTRILPISEQALQDLYMYLERNPEIRIKIIGHTDNVGKDAANQKLSEGRAEEVRKDLIERGVAPERIESEGRGESQPIDTNDTEEGRQNNRRVEIEIL